MSQLHSQLGATEAKLSWDLLDRIDEIVPPGTNVSARDTGYVPDSLSDPGRRRRTPHP